MSNRVKHGYGRNSKVLCCKQSFFFLLYIPWKFGHVASSGFSFPVEGNAAHLQMIPHNTMTIWRLLGTKPRNEISLIDGFKLSTGVLISTDLRTFSDQPCPEICPLWHCVQFEVINSRAGVSEKNERGRVRAESGGELLEYSSVLIIIDYSDAEGRSSRISATNANTSVPVISVLFPASLPFYLTVFRVVFFVSFLSSVSSFFFAVLHRVHMFAFDFSV